MQSHYMTKKNLMQWCSVQIWFSVKKGELDRKWEKTEFGQIWQNFHVLMFFHVSTLRKTFLHFWVFLKYQENIYEKSPIFWYSKNAQKYGKQIYKDEKKETWEFGRIRFSPVLVEFYPFPEIWNPTPLRGINVTVILYFIKNQLP